MSRVRELLGEDDPEPLYFRASPDPGGTLVNGGWAVYRGKGKRKLFYVWHTTSDDYADAQDSYAEARRRADELSQEEWDEFEAEEAESDDWDWDDDDVDDYGGDDDDDE